MTAMVKGGVMDATTGIAGGGMTTGTIGGETDTRIETIGGGGERRIVRRKEVLIVSEKRALAKTEGMIVRLRGDTVLRHHLSGLRRGTSAVCSPSPSFRPSMRCICWHTVIAARSCACS